MNGPIVSDRILFERLCLYRELYARRGPQDRASTMTVAEAIRKESGAGAPPPALPAVG